MEQGTIKQLEDLRGTANGEAIRFYLDEKIKEMTDIEHLTTGNLEAKQEAVKILKNLFRFLEKKSELNLKTKYN